ncbi:ATP-binding cassette domain-containing protein [Pontixanthobacter sp.]|uniref:ATP-binding cassette domain-containing protein n=1 Tax=Pontixanthobacter sp. TaxID=2792078 RepID=UPI003C797F7D
MSFDLHITKHIGERRIDCRIQTSQQLIALIGPSGAGKTTLLNCIAGLMVPDAGHIDIAGQTLFNAGDGTNLRPEVRGCGYVFQDSRLFPHMSVERNLLYGIRNSGASSSYTLEGIADLLDIADLLQRRPANLSGGEQRRVAIGRAVLSGPHFLLLDEPLSALDSERGDKVLSVIEHLRDDTGMPIVYVSHRANEVRRLTQSVFTVT